MTTEKNEKEKYLSKITVILVLWALCRAVMGLV